jgi:hypothetical protein
VFLQTLTRLVLFGVLFGLLFVWLFGLLLGLSIAQFVNTAMEVENWLATLDMAQYSNIMVSFGFTDLLSLQSLQRLDLQGMGIPDEHIDAILAAVVDMKSEPPPLPSQSVAVPLASDSEDDVAVSKSPARSMTSDGLDGDRKDRLKKGSRHKHKPSIGGGSGGSPDVSSIASDGEQDEDSKFLALLCALDDTYRMNIGNGNSPNITTTTTTTK